MSRVMLVAAAVLLIVFAIIGMAALTIHQSRQAESEMLTRIDAMRPTVEPLPERVYVYAAWINCKDLSTGQMTDIIRLTWPADAQDATFRACRRRQP